MYSFLPCFLFYVSLYSNFFLFINNCHMLITSHLVTTWPEYHSTFLLRRFLATFISCTTQQTTKIIFRLDDFLHALPPKCIKNFINSSPSISHTWFLQTQESVLKYLRTPYLVFVDWNKLVPWCNFSVCKYKK